MTDLTLENLQTALVPIHAKLDEFGRRLATIEGQLAGIDHRFAAMDQRFSAIDGRLAHLQTIGTWLIAGLLGSYAAILAVALHTPAPPVVFHSPPTVSQP